MKKAISAILACALVTVSAPAASAKKYSVYDTLTGISQTVEANVGKDGLYSMKNTMVRVKDGVITPYTGFAKTKKGTYCYYNGIKWTGWYKQSGKWYYFDPKNNGLMVSTAVKTSLGTYYLDKNGAWNGKCTKSAKCPADFDYVFRCGGGLSTEYFFSTKDGILGRDAYLDGIDTEKEFTLSPQDKQIIYDVFKSSGAESFDEAAVIDTVGKNPEIITDLPVYSVAWYMGDSFYGDVYAESYIFGQEYYSRSEEVRKFAGLIRFSRMYLESRPEYKKIIAEENAYLEAHKYDYAPFEELDKVKTSAADVYKFRGHFSPGGGRAILITSKAEMDELITMLKKERMSSKSKLMVRLSSYSESYFKDNVVIFGDCHGDSGSVKPHDPEVYKGYSNVYLRMVMEYPECYTDDECYLAAVADVSKKEIFGDNKTPSVIWRRTRINYEGNEF